MGKLSNVLRSVDDDKISFWCGGCQTIHVIKVSGEDSWEWNGNTVSPTIKPSILVTSGHFLPTHKPGDPCWCEYNKTHPEDEHLFDCYRCHLYVENGRLRYLEDCSHYLAGCIILMLDLPDEVSL